ncbi:N-acetyltransferase [Streptomyces sp. NBC_01795]|uniref:N-acetyltransferase n=1 Tax=unclassified Streptomyces TaxID=2593676 RepID=UPI002DD8470F|nr:MULTISPECIES: N-acetyltransferase [unclassified Streptomyces]WSA91140.1 N-acetyltransferase [Streptomyces sp. NBC_01795]WSB75463.1 N-acetyltransferase [Streptomyces sp. NBC_01775]
MTRKRLTVIEPARLVHLLSTSSCEVALPSEAPRLAAQVSYEPLWPRFLFAAPSMRLYRPLGELWPYSQLLLAEPGSGRLLGWLDTAPVFTDGGADGLPGIARGLPGGGRGLPGGWDDLMRRAVEGLRAGHAPDTLAMMSLSLLPAARGIGLGAAAIALARALASLLELRAVLAPVRPTLKAACPQVPMGEYMRRVRTDGLPADPWLRAHVRAGGRVAGVATASTVMEAPLEDWAAWGASLPPAGDGTIEGALSPLELLPDGRTARYTEPNVWVIHSAERFPAHP